MKLMIAVDGSPASLAAVRHALAWRAAGAAPQIVLANVQEPPSLYEVVTAHDAERLDDVRRRAGADLLAGAEDLLRAAGAEAWEAEVAGGEPVNTLVELAENHGCDAIVCGRGRTGFELARRAPMPVTLVPAPDDDAEPAAGGA